MYSKLIGADWQPPISSNEKEMLSLLIVDGHMLIVFGSKALESLSLLQSQNRIESSCKNDTMLIESKFHNFSSVFRIKFTSREQALKCHKHLHKYIKANHYDVEKEQYLNLPQLLAREMRRIEPELEAPESIPDEYPLEAAIQLCILDPGFPQLIKKIEDILKKN